MEIFEFRFLFKAAIGKANIAPLYMSDVLFILRRIQAGGNTSNNKQEYYKLIKTFQKKGFDEKYEKQKKIFHATFIDTQVLNKQILTKTSKMSCLF